MSPGISARPRRGSEAEEATPAPEPGTTKGGAASGGPVPAQMPREIPPQLREAIAQVKAHVEKNSEYVGKSFASEARAIHEGETPERMIHGEAAPEEARELIEEGVPIAPLPFIPTRKTN